MSPRSYLFACVLLFRAPLAAAQPQFWFDPLPELPGGASSCFQVVDSSSPLFGFWSVGQSLDGDGLWKAVVWTKEFGKSWEIEILPNPFGNTESSCNAPTVHRQGSGDVGYAAGYAHDSEGNPQPVVWTGDGVGPWTVEIPPLPAGYVAGNVLGTGAPDTGVQTLSMSGYAVTPGGIHHAVLWRKDQNGIWSIELLPDFGSGFYSEALAIERVDVDGMEGDDHFFIGGHAQPESGFGHVPCVWEEQPGGVFGRVDLLMTPNAYRGSVRFVMTPWATNCDAGDFSVAGGFNATIGGLGDLHRGVIYRRDNGIWGPPLELWPLPSERDAKATGALVGAGNSSACLMVVGHSYVKFHEAGGQATLWEVASDNTVTTYDMDALTVNLPPGVELAFANTGGDRLIDWQGFGGSFRNSDAFDVPHGNILVLLSQTDCNKNGQDDALDLYSGTSADANGNGSPDECEPRFSFEALPELPGGASEVFGFGGADDMQDNVVRYSEFAVGRSLDGDGIRKAVVWLKPVGLPWQIEVLPNPFGNTESIALYGYIPIQPNYSDLVNSIGGLGNNADGIPQPVLWRRDQQSLWVAEIMPLPPGFDSGAVLAGATGDDSLPPPPPDVCGWIDQSAGPEPHHAALWRRNNNGVWIVELLPDNGPGFASQANAILVNTLDGLLIAAGEVQSDSGQLVSAIWEEQAGGGFALVDVPMTPGNDVGAILDLSGGAFGELYAVGYESMAVGSGVKQGVLYRRFDGVWSPPSRLLPLPGFANSIALSWVNDTTNVDDVVYVVGHSDNGPGTEKATMWVVDGLLLPQAAAVRFNLNDVTVNLPPDLSLQIAADGVMGAGLAIEYFAGTFTNDSGAAANPGNSPHAFVLKSFPDLPQADATGTDKTRFISFSPAGPEVLTALRVKLTSLHHVVPAYTGGASIPFTAFEGQVRWIGPPVQYVESTATQTPFLASQLQCTPHYRDWSTVGLLHVTGSAIVPSSVYQVANVAPSCIGNEASCTAISVPLQIATTRWADVETPYNPPSSTTQPDVGDIAALVNKFRSVGSAPIKARALLVGTDAFGTITPGSMSLDFDFTHIAACVDGFRGKAYPYTISSCP